MNYNKLGLKEIRFINSGHFPNENVIIDDFTLFLGSSGVGKTTVMSAVCYFYTMDKEKTRPEKKELSFYDWHLAGSYSHLIYIYENHIGKNILMLSKEDGRVKHTFINIQNYEEDISSLYLDEDNRCLTLTEILANCLKQNLPYYKSATVPTFRKVMCKKSYNLLPNKDKPKIDFSFYDNEESANVFGKYLFNIYSNSSVRDKGIKDMLISLISGKEYSLDILEFKNKLSDALKNVSHFELIKNRKDKILNLDDTIITYNALVDEINKKVYELESIVYNKESIEKVISEKELSFLTQQKIELDKKTTLKTDLENKLTIYSDELASLKNSIKNYEEQYHIFIQKNKIENLLLEEKKENEYKLKVDEISIKIGAISSSIEELGIKENLDKQKVRSELSEKKELEKHNLEEKKDNLNKTLLQLSKNKDIKIENVVSTIEQELEVKQAEYNHLDKQISKDETTIALLPNQNLENNNTKKMQDELERLTALKTSTQLELSTLEKEKKELEILKNENYENIQKKRAKYNEEYINEKTNLKSKIDNIYKKLDIGKNNLFGFLNKNEVPNKRKILALTSDEILFEEQNLKFSIDNTNNTFYGLKIDGDVESFATKYDIETLENAKSALQKQLTDLTARNTIKSNTFESELKLTSNKYKKIILQKSQQMYSLSPKIKDYEIKINNEKTRLKNEKQRLKDELKSQILSKKQQLQKDKTQLNELQKYIQNLKEKIISLKDEINKNYKKEEDNLNKQLAECTKSLNTINAKYKKLINESDNRIHLTYNEIRKKENIDTDELEALQKMYNQLTKKLNLISNNKHLTSRYNNEVLPNYNKIAGLKEQTKTLKEQRDSDKTYFNNEISIVEDNLKDITKSIEIWQNYKVSFKKFEDDVSKVLLNTSRSYKPYLDNEIVLLLKNKTNINTLDNYKTLTIQKAEREKTIKSETRNIIDGIPADNMMQLKTKLDINSFDDDIQQYISIAKSYVNFVKTQFDIEGTSLQLHRLIETINDAVSKISHIKSTFDSIVKDVHKINATIRDGIKNITVIDFIKLNFKDIGKDEIVTKIESIGEMLSANMLIGYENSKRSEQVKDELVQIAQDLQTILETTFKKSITVADISTLTFDVSENGQVTKGIATLDNVGSNGTSIMVKAIIYITLLKMVTNKFTNTKHTNYHCIIDEIGQISADYFTELMQYAKELKFVFINGTAANDDDIIEAYPRIYMGTRESQNQVELNLIDTINAMENWS